MFVQNLPEKQKQNRFAIKQNEILLEEIENQNLLK